MSVRNKIIFRTQNPHFGFVILKISQWYFWDSQILVYCLFDSYFATKVQRKKTSFSNLLFLLLLSERGLNPESCLAVIFSSFSSTSLLNISFCLEINGVSLRSYVYFSIVILLSDFEVFKASACFKFCLLYYLLLGGW